LAVVATSRSGTPSALTSAIAIELGTLMTLTQQKLLSLLQLLSASVASSSAAAPIRRRTCHSRLMNPELSTSV
jgi:hypothetical protein